MKIDTAAIKAHLRAVYCQPEYALAFEVSDATGGRASRRADAVAMGMWPSRGLLIHGFEIKVSRGDWLRELKAPQKAESIWRYCDAWTLITGPDVAQEDEIPAGWGWDVFDGKRLVTKVPAAARQAEPPSREFVAAMLRAAGKPDEDEVRAMRNRERQRLQEEFEARLAADVAREVELKTLDMERQRRLFAAVERMIPEDQRKHLDDDEFAAAVRLVLASGAASRFNDFRRLHDHLIETTERLGAALTAAAVPSKEELQVRSAALCRPRTAAAVTA